jgi:hypothetical protein
LRERRSCRWEKHDVSTGTLGTEIKPTPLPAAIAMRRT